MEQNQLETSTATLELIVYDFARYRTTSTTLSSRSVTWESSSHLIEELFETIKECSHDNWDGYGAVPIKKRAAQEAASFATRIPVLLPIPEVVPEPSGDIGFQWSFGQNRMITVSFEGNDTVTYACILGSYQRTKFGREFFNDRIPQEVVQGIEEIRT